MLYFPLASGLAVASNISGTAVGNTAIVDQFVSVSDPQQALVPLQVVLFARQIVGGSTAPTVSVGTNSPTFDNIVAATALTGVQENRFTTILPRPNAVPITSTAAFVRVSAASNATTWRFHVGVLLAAIKTAI